MDDLITFAAFRREADRKTQSYLAELAAWRDIGEAVQRLEARRPGLGAELEAERQAIVAARAAALVAAAQAEIEATPSDPPAIEQPAPAAEAQSKRVRRRR